MLSLSVVSFLLSLNQTLIYQDMSWVVGCHKMCPNCPNEIRPGILVVGKCVLTRHILVIYNVSPACIKTSPRKICLGLLIVLLV